MIAIPALDLRDGACVQLVGGSYDEERIRLGDPVGVARRFAESGFRRLHVVDLDAATGAGSNSSLVDRILSSRGAAVQIGGGIRRSDDIERLIDAGAAQVIVGTRALEDPEWLGEQAARWPNRLVVALDVRSDRVVVEGWRREIATPLAELLQSIDPLPLGAILVTAVHVEGRLEGPDLTLLERVRAATKHPLVASGGIATMEDLRALASLGADACVIGMAIYSGALDPARVAHEFGEET